LTNIKCVLFQIKRSTYISSYLNSNGKFVQRVSMQFKAKGFLQYQVRFMVGLALQYQRGDISSEGVLSLINEPGLPLKIPRELARPEGLTMISCKFKKGIISDTPIDIPEEKFCRN
jgi:tRNA U38,U39,U40 pseudouridine synthase TruA